MVVGAHLLCPRIKERASYPELVSEAIQRSDCRFGPLYDFVQVFYGAKDENSEVFPRTFVCRSNGNSFEFTLELFLALAPICERALEKAIVGRIRFARRLD